MLPLTIAMSLRAACVPISYKGWDTVVSGGSIYELISRSSKPTMDISSGTLRPQSFTARIAPIALGSLAAKIASGIIPFQAGF